MEYNARIGVKRAVMERSKIGTGSFWPVFKISLQVVVIFNVMLIASFVLLDIQNFSYKREKKRITNKQLYT